MNSVAIVFVMIAHLAFAGAALASEFADTRVIQDRTCEVQIHTTFTDPQRIIPEFLLDRRFRPVSAASLRDGDLLFKGDYDSRMEPDSKHYMYANIQLLAHKADGRTVLLFSKTSKALVKGSHPGEMPKALGSALRSALETFPYCDLKPSCE